MSDNGNVGVKVGDKHSVSDKKHRAAILAQLTEKGEISAAETAEIIGRSGADCHPPLRRHNLIGVSLPACVRTAAEHPPVPPNIHPFPKYIGIRIRRVYCRGAPMRCRVNGCTAPPVTAAAIVEVHQLSIL